jgi:hypothetical protein
LSAWPKCSWFCLHCSLQTAASNVLAHSLPMHLLTWVRCHLPLKQLSRQSPWHSALV